MDCLQTNEELRLYDSRVVDMREFNDVPNFLFKNDRFKNLSNDAKILYLLLRKKAYEKFVEILFDKKLAEGNSCYWHKDDDLLFGKDEFISYVDIFIEYPVEEMKNDLNLSAPIISKIRKELSNAGLMKIEHVGWGENDKLFVYYIKEY